MKFPTEEGSSLSFDQSVFIDQKTLYKAHHETNKVVVGNLSSGTTTSTFFINDCSISITGGPYKTTSEYVIIKCDGDKTFVFIDKFNYTEIKRINLPNNKGIVLDDDSVYMAYYYMDDFYKLMKKTFDEKIMGEIILEESKKIYGFEHQQIFFIYLCSQLCLAD